MLKFFSALIAIGIGLTSLKAQYAIDTIPIFKEICEMPAVIGTQAISRPYIFKRKRSNERTLNITVNYLPPGTYSGGRVCTTWPAAAQTAFNYAVDVWSDVIENSQNIGIEACWATSLAPGVLGSAGTTGIYNLSGGGLDPTLFPSALAEHLIDAQLQVNDIRATFNANRSDWYFGTDAQPGFLEYDFVSVIIHEIGHGLGFFGLRALDNGAGPPECDGVANTGCVGLKVSGNYIPSMYERHIDKISDGAGILSLPNPGEEIYNLLTGTGGGLSFDETNPCVFYGGSTNSPMYTPNPFAGGSSYSHFDEATFPNELMTPFLTNGQAIHDVGLAANLMYNIGWSTPFPLLTATDLTDTGDGALRSAIERACPNSTITFDNGLNGDVILTNGEITISNPLVIIGNGMNNIGISGNNANRIFNITSSGALELRDMTLKNAMEAINGGAIFLNGGNLTMENITLINNKEGATSKAITTTTSSTVIVKSSVIIDN
jgi:hypothetical protein